MKVIRENALEKDVDGKALSLVEVNKKNPRAIGVFMCLLTRLGPRQTKILGTRERLRKLTGTRTKRILSSNLDSLVDAGLIKKRIRIVRKIYPGQKYRRITEISFPFGRAMPSATRRDSDKDKETRIPEHWYHAFMTIHKSNGFHKDDYDALKASVNWLRKSKLAKCRLVRIDQINPDRVFVAAENDGFYFNLKKTDSGRYVELQSKNKEISDALFSSTDSCVLFSKLSQEVAVKFQDMIGKKHPCFKPVFSESDFNG